ncbi:PaaI family thioesterase [Kocuria sp. M1N1S27]|uniref:PaaI family thioesterase n=1 Tax=Kocuria kalidii TaxID=3376283 RepID=UPI0037918235
MAVPGTLEEFQRRWEEFCAGLTHEEIVDTLGLVPYAVSEDSLSFAMPLVDRLRQAGGMFSATALFGAADITGTYLALQFLSEEGKFPLAIQASTNFLANTTQGTAVATARLLRAGRTVTVAQVSVTDTAGKHLAEATFTYALK